MTKRCIFCGERVDSREHVWPQWLVRIIEPLPGSNKTLFAIRTNKDGQSNRWKRSTPELVTKSVCRGCNEGWMSDMEQTTKPILCPMIKGEETTLTTIQQTRIAIWMLKVAIVLDSMSFEARFYEESERFHFRATFLPPGFLTFWLGYYSGSHWSGFTNHRILTNEKSVPPYKSYVLTMAFGRLVLQLCNSKLATFTNAVARKFPVRNGDWSIVEFSPHLNRSILWPPFGPSFDDSERKLETFSERFGGPPRN